MSRPTRRPALYYGWVLITMLAITTLVSWGVTYYAFSVVLTPMQRTLGWSSANLTGAFSLCLLAGGVADIFVGRWLDAHGPRVLMTIGSIAVTLLMLAWSQIDSLPGFYALMAALGVFASMVQYSPAFWLATTWFKRRRALALTIITIGGGLASTLFVPLTSALVQAGGWRYALFVLAGVTALVTILPHALLLRRAPADVHAQIDGVAEHIADAPEPATTPPAPDSQPINTLRQPLFWLLALAFALAGLAFNGISVHLLSYQLAFGQDPAFAAAAAGFSGVMQVLGRILIVPLGDRVPRNRLLLVLMICQLLSYLALLALPLNAGLIAHVMLRGIGAGPQSPIRAALIGDLFGTRHYGRTTGQMAFITSIAGAVSPFAVGLFVGVGGYTPVPWFFAGALVIAVLVIARLPKQAAQERA
jgi:MFS family permease